MREADFNQSCVKLVVDNSAEQDVLMIPECRSNEPERNDKDVIKR